MYNVLDMIILKFIIYYTTFKNNHEFQKIRSFFALTGIQDIGLIIEKEKIILWLKFMDNFTHIFFSY